jgi:hypothetical protein
VLLLPASVRWGFSEDSTVFCMCMGANRLVGLHVFTCPLKHLVEGGELVHGPDMTYFDLLRVNSLI